MSWTDVVVEADGGSRGNPGPAAFGAVLKDAVSGETIAEVGETIGTASNNVAEYRGLIAGLELAAEHAPGAGLEVRMDSQLVIEQMAGRWKVKHPSMKPLHAQASRLAPAGTVWTWVPRAENGHADRLVNEALDGTPTYFAADRPGPSDEAESRTTPARGWMPPGEPPTTLVLVRHGVTDHTANRLFSGGLGGSNPPLNEEGEAQVRATGTWLAPLAEAVDALVTSPVRRTAESAAILGAQLGLEAKVEAGIAEMEFGAWDGMTFTQIQETYPDDLASWLGNLDHAPTGGESFRLVQERVLAGRDRIIADHTGQTVVVVSHVTPIKTLVADALGAPLDAIYKMELAPASVTVISYFRGNPPNSGREDDHLLASLRLYNGRPTDAPFTL